MEECVGAELHKCELNVRSWRVNATRDMRRLPREEPGLYDMKKAILAGSTKIAALVVTGIVGETSNVLPNTLNSHRDYSR